MSTETVSTETVSTETVSTESSGAAAEAWRAWRADRAATLRAPRGVLSLTSHHWLGAEPAPVHGVPGLWWADDDGAHVRAEGDAGFAEGDAAFAEGDAAFADGDAAFADGDAGFAEGDAAVLLDAETLRPVEGRRTVVVAEAGSAVPFLVAPGPLLAGPGTPPGEDAERLPGVELALRTGRYLLRTRDPRAAALAAFVAAGDAAVVSAFDFDRAQVRDLPVRWFGEPRAAVVDGAKPGLVHHVQVVGEVDVDGTTLGLVAGHRGGVTLSFTDRAEGTPAWRAVHVPDADVEASRAAAVPSPGGVLEGTIRVDLNRATAYPSHFNDHGTCPRPLAGNDLPFAVEAGEKDPR